MKSLKKAIPAALLLLLLPISSAFRVAILSDIHLQPFYDPYIDARTYCTRLQPIDILDPPQKSNTYAPLGRIFCDSPDLLVESFFKKINETEGKIDILMLTGDMVGHKLCVEPDEEPNPELYEKLKRVHSVIADYIVKYLPNTLVLPTLGNNDYKYHYQSPYENEKEEFYKFFFEQYFKKQQVNNKLENLADIHTNIMNGGYYRVDISDNISFLGLNTLMFNRRNEPSMQECQQADQLQWIERQFQDPERNRKFILSNHIYPGSKIENRKLLKLWHHNYTQQIIPIIQKYNHKILIEISGHDHVSDLRYNKGSNVLMSNKFLNDDSYNSDYNFHNLLISPGVTSATAQNPGYTIFEVCNSEVVAKELKMVFLPVEKTYNWTEIPSEISSWPWRNVDFKSKFGINKLTADEMDKLKNKLVKDEKFLWEYLTLKVGYNPEDPLELKKSQSLHINEVGIVDDDMNTYMYKCQMYNSLGHEGFIECMEKHKPKKYQGRLITYKE